MYIIDNKKQIQRINEMVPLRKNMETFEVYYHDPSTGELWKSFFPKGYKQHEGPKLLRVDPLPKQLELQLEICLNSPDDSDAIGLGIECSVKPDQWKEILNVLNKNRKQYLRTNLNTFIKHLGVLTPHQTLTEIETEPSEVGLSNEDLSKITKRAKHIKLKRFFHI